MTLASHCTSCQDVWSDGCVALLGYPPPPPPHGYNLMEHRSHNIAFADAVVGVVLGDDTGDGVPEILADDCFRSCEIDVILDRCPSLFLDLGDVLADRCCC